MAGRRAGQNAPEKWVGRFVRPFQVEPGKKVELGRDFDTASKAGIDSKADGIGLLSEMVQLLADYQARLAAQDTWGLLVVLQAIDAGGKDGTIRHVMSGVNPQGVSVHSFKVPSDEELDHDYLWRYGLRLPSRGQIGVFNRSHYEEVLVVRVHAPLIERQKLPPEARGPGIWRRRYREINNWERHLSDNGIRIVKLFLNLSKEEQRRRFIQRIDDPDRNWKFSPADLDERKLWDDYQQRVLGDALEHEHEVGAVARDPGRPQVVRARRRSGSDRERAGRDRSEVPGRERRDPGAVRGAARGARGGGARSRRRGRGKRPRQRLTAAPQNASLSSIEFFPSPSRSSRSVPRAPA